MVHCSLVQVVLNSQPFQVKQSVHVIADLTCDGNGPILLDNKTQQLIFKFEMSTSEIKIPIFDVLRLPCICSYNTYPMTLFYCNANCILIVQGSMNDLPT